MGCVMKMYRDWQVSEKYQLGKERFHIFVDSYPVMMIS